MPLDDISQLHAQGLRLTDRMNLVEWATVGTAWLLLAYASVDPLLEISRQVTGFVIPRSALLIAQVVDWAGWMVLLRPLFRAMDRTPLVRGRVLRHGLARAFLLTGLALVHAVLTVPVFHGLAPLLHVPAPMLASPLFTPAKLLWDDLSNVWVGATAYFILGRVYRTRFTRQRAARLEALLTEARLQTLSTQLQPHFLFNTLNSIAALIPDDPLAAESTVMKLSGLLRATLDAGDSQVALGEELDRLMMYVDIQVTRFGQRLTVDISAPAELTNAAVPAMLLQPLVENAIAHGIAPRREGGRIGVEVAREGDRLRLVVWDDGLGLPSAGLTEGIGVRNTRERIAATYGEGGSFSIAARPEGGTKAEILLPYAPCAGPRSTTGDRCG